MICNLAFKPTCDMSAASLLHDSLHRHSMVLHFYYLPCPSGKAPHRPTDCLHISKSPFHWSQQNKNAELNIDFKMKTELR